MTRVGILWDLDGTLLDTLQDLADATNFALRAHGCPERTVDEVRRFVGNGARQLIHLATAGQADTDAVLATFRSYYDDHCRIKTKAYDGILEALAELGKHYPQAIVSNKPDSAVKLLSDLYFGGIFARGEDVDCPRKPAPDMVFQAMAAIGVDTCIYVGDSEVDVLTAKNAGVPCLSVLWGFRDRQALLDAGAKYYCQNPNDLPKSIEQILHTEIISVMEENHGQ